MADTLIPNLREAASSVHHAGRDGYYAGPLPENEDEDEAHPRVRPLPCH